MSSKKLSNIVSVKLSVSAENSTLNCFGLEVEHILSLSHLAAYLWYQNPVQITE